MKTNLAGIKLLHDFESCRLESYLCQAMVWTIGWGNTFYANGAKVKQGEKITQPMADRLFEVILGRFEDQVRPLIKSKVTQNQFSAIMSFTYNLGVANLKSSTLLKKVNANPDDPTIANEFSKWINAGGVPSNGLRRRRKAESDLYFKKY
jgi:lysozyme